MMRTPTQLSPQQLCQELVRDDGWKVLVVCIMLNQTTGTQVRRVFPEFFKRWPKPDLLGFPQYKNEMTEMLRPLGFQNRKTERIVQMSWDYQVLDIPNHPERVEECRGVGKYAADSYKMFVGGYLILNVQDKELKRYVRWAQEVGGGETDHAGSGGVQ